MWMVLAALVVLCIMVLSERLRRKGMHAELTRKMVHILVGSFVAFWPFFLSWKQIQILALLAIVGVGISVRYHVFQSVHDVARNATGEFLFAIMIGLLSFLTTSKWVFAASMLTLSIGDGMAAIIGLLYGDNNRYKVMGHTKTLAGSLAFFFTTLIIMICYAAFSHEPYSATTIIWLPVAATIAENLAVQGIDNGVLPLLVALVLSSSL